MKQYANSGKTESINTQSIQLGKLHFGIECFLNSYWLSIDFFTYPLLFIQCSVLFYLPFAICIRNCYRFLLLIRLPMLLESHEFTLPLFHIRKWQFPISGCWLNQITNRPPQMTRILSSTLGHNIEPNVREFTINNKFFIESMQPYWLVEMFGKYFCLNLWIFDQAWFQVRYARVFTKRTLNTYIHTRTHVWLPHEKPKLWILDGV